MPRISLAQEDLWFVTQLAPGAPAYNEVVQLRRTGPLDVDAFTRAFNEVVRRHDAWRMSFVVDDAKALQRVETDVVYDIPVTDLSSLGQVDAEAAALRMA